MKRAAKLAMGAAAFAAPIALGWALTGSPSLLSGGPFGHHTVDEWEVNGHWVYREEIDGKVTEIVTGPDGEVLTGDEIPADIADMLANWLPPEPTVDVDLDSSPVCYAIVGEVVDGEESVGDENGRGYALRADRATDGSAVVEAVAFEDFPTGNVVNDYMDTGAPLSDLPGATEIGEC